MTGQRLRRPLYARLFGTVAQGVLSIYAAGTVALVILSAWGQSTQWSWWFLVLLVLDLLWLRAVTGWATVDDNGIHVRYWVRWDYPWDTIHSVTLQRLENYASVHNRGAPAIIVRRKDDEDGGDRIAPALRCGRRRREFGAALLDVARTHGTRTQVGSTGWDMTVQRRAEPFNGI